MAECMERFLKLRKRLFKTIGEALKEDCGKSYEGFFSINIEYPNYYEDENAGETPFCFCIHLDCYVIGPHRHYDWVGKTFEEALDKCERDINEWLEETEEFDFPCDAEPLVEKICIGKENDDG